MVLGMSGITGTIITVLVVIAGIILLGGIMGFGAYFALNKKKFGEYKCVILEWDGTGNINQTEDRAGVFVDGKTNNKRFFMEKNKVGLNPDNIPYIRSRNGRTVYMLRSGLKNFRFLNFSIANPNFEIMVGEEDVNWAVNAYDRAKKAFMQNWIAQIMPFITILLAAFAIIILVYLVVSKFDVLASTADSLREAAIAVKEAKVGSTVITSAG